MDIEVDNHALHEKEKSKGSKKHPLEDDDASSNKRSAVDKDIQSSMVSFSSLDTYIIVSSIFPFLTGYEISRTTLVSKNFYGLSGTRAAQSSSFASIIWKNAFHSEYGMYENYIPLLQQPSSSASSNESTQQQQHKECDIVNVAQLYLQQYIKHYKMERISRVHWNDHKTLMSQQQLNTYARTEDASERSSSLSAGSTRAAASSDVNADTRYAPPLPRQGTSGASFGPYFFIYGGWVDRQGPPITNDIRVLIVPYESNSIDQSTSAGVNESLLPGSVIEKATWRIVPRASNSFVPQPTYGHVITLITEYSPEKTTADFIITGGLRSGGYRDETSRALLMRVEGLNPKNPLDTSNIRHRFFLFETNLNRQDDDNINDEDEIHLSIARAYHSATFVTSKELAKRRSNSMTIQDNIQMDEECQASDLGQLIIFGGFDENGVISNLRVFRITNLNTEDGASPKGEWYTPDQGNAVFSAPHARFGHSATLVRGNILLIAGGTTAPSNYKGSSQGREFYDIWAAQLNPIRIGNGYVIQIEWWQKGIRSSNEDLLASATTSTSQSTPPLKLQGSFSITPSREMSSHAPFARCHSAIHVPSASIGNKEKLLFFGGGPPGGVTKNLTLADIDLENRTVNLTVLPSYINSKGYKTLHERLMPSMMRKSPKARQNHCAALVNNDTVVIYGGCIADPFAFHAEELGDTWFFPLVTPSLNNKASKISSIFSSTATTAAASAIGMISSIMMPSSAESSETTTANVEETENDGDWQLEEDADEVEEENTYATEQGQLTNRSDLVRYLFTLVRSARRPRTNDNDDDDEGEDDENDEDYVDDENEEETDMEEEDDDDDEEEEDNEEEEEEEGGNNEESRREGNEDMDDE